MVVSLKFWIWIVEHEQKGQEKAKYGKGTLKQLSDALTQEFGKGFSIRNIETMRKFYLTYRKTQTPSAELESSTLKPTSFTLSWSHYVFLMRLPEHERCFYEIEATENNWSLRELNRQFNSALYDRLRLSRDKEGVKALSENGQLINNPQDAVKDPYILEFLGLCFLRTRKTAWLKSHCLKTINRYLLANIKLICPLKQSLWLRLMK